MSYPGEPSDASGKDLSAFASTELTADDFERLAASFRPSWQLDEAPFAGPSSMTPSEIRTLQANDARAEVRSLVQQSTNGAHPPPRATVALEPHESVIVEGASPPASAARPMPVPVSVSVPTPAHSPAARRVAPAVPKARPRLASLELDGVVPSFARKPRTSLWLGLGALAVVGGAIGIWVATNGSQPTAPSPGPPATEPPTAVSAAPIVPELPTAPAPPPAPPPPAATAASAPASGPLPMASPPITMRPAVLPTVTTTSPAPTPITMRASTPPPTAAKPPPQQPAPKATARPKPTATTIVRDVPF